MSAATTLRPACARALDRSSRALGALLGTVAMVAGLAWVWLEPSVPVMVLTWVSWCVGIRLWGRAAGCTPSRWCYLAAVLPAASPLLLVLLVYAVWAPLAG